ncbi:acyl-CoA dehydrogenase [Ancylobacter sp. Lp-2]|uniref:acyl-CoA dehydrogenase family protein n=1 Tax=Ancylobacter sp. Lp-2 TaxID=2881339 RepID=UPI001E47BFA0|nr:acyl-CoA dehydrogenase family protein [Ancylobacter sp. Lp-2]MCB4769727.1 acyl-CoA dehydrogenase [Ancylobacter sp. Lp-2]
MNRITTPSATNPTASPATAARGLAPTLRARAAETSRLGRLPAATIEELEQAGLFRLCMPAIYGGDEASLDTLLDVSLELGAADGSVAWTHAILAGGIWMAAALYPPETTDKVFGSGRPFRTASVMAPSRVRTRRVAGGLHIEEGQWAFNSGIHHAQWDVASVPILDEGGNQVDFAAALLPVEELTLLDDWDTFGLRGTGSVSVTAENVFVPDDRLASYSRVLADDFASSHLRDRPSFNLPVLPMLATKLAFPCLAVAREALGLFVDRAPFRPIALTFYPAQSEATVTHLYIGEASVKIDAAETILRRSIAHMEAAAASRQPLAREQRARIWRDATFAARLCWEAVDLLAGVSGGGFARSDSPMNRHWHDLRAATLHAGLSTTTTFEIFGRLVFGLPPNSPLV